MDKNKDIYHPNFKASPLPVEIHYLGSFKASVLFDNDEKLILNFALLQGRIKRGPWTEPLFTEEGCRKVSLSESGDIVFPNTSFDILWSYVYGICMESADNA